MAFITLLKKIKYTRHIKFKLESNRTLQSVGTFNTPHRQEMEGKVKAQIKLNYITVYENNKKLDFPFVWLRDNCQCAKCFHLPSKSRIIDWDNFNVDIKPLKIQSINDKEMKIIWEDNHLSEYSIEWLKERSFLNENRQHYAKTTYRPETILWNKNNFNSVLKKFDFSKIMNSNQELKDWLMSLSIYGIALITNVPEDYDSCRNIANRIDFIKKTHFGEEFELKSKPTTKSIAYTPMHLQLHTDSPYYEYMPGVNLLHCITQTEDVGGENMICDGFYIANLMKTCNNNEYVTLSKTPVYWRVIGEENGNKFHNMLRSPVLCEDFSGKVTRINYTVSQRGSHFDVSIDKVKPWYEALKCFIDTAQEHSTNIKISHGQMLTFDNTRLLHGRTAYRDTLANTRHLVGAYVDWDYIYSRLRVLGKNNL